MSNLVQYQDWTNDELKEDKKRAAKERAGKYLRYPDDGRLTVRFLPPRMGEPRFMKVPEHFYKNEKDDWVKYVCPEKSGVRDCYDCARARKLYSTNNKADAARARDFVAKFHIYANVVDRDDEIFGPKIVDLRVSQTKRLWEGDNSIRDIKGNFTDPTDKGYDVLLTKSGKGMKTEYGAFDGARCELGDLGWIARQEDLRPMGAVLSAEDLEKMYGIPILIADDTDMSDLV